MIRLHRQWPALLALGFSLLLGSVAVHADEELAVVVSSSMEGIDLDDATLHAIYLKKIFLDKAGESLIPVNLPADSPLRQAFSSAVVHLDEDQLRNYWNRRYFQGVSPPYVLGSQKAVVRFIATTPGALGYVRPCFLDSSVRTLMRIAIPANQAAKVNESCPPVPDA